MIAAALVVGVLFDRLLLARNGWLSQEAQQKLEVSAATPTIEMAAAPESSVTTQARAPLPAHLVEPASAEKSLDAILAKPDARGRTRELQAFIDTLSPSEYGDALKRLRLITSSNERELATRLLIAHWIQSDPDGALQFAASNRGFEYLADDVFQQLAAGDSQAALTKAQAIPGNELRYRALRGVLSVMADTDPAEAIRLAPTLGAFRDHESFGSVLYRQWASRDPQAAALHAAENGEAGGGWGSPVAQVVNTWADKDPAAAANWTLSLPQDERQRWSLAQVTREWGRDDPNSAANWIHALPAGPSRDAAVAGLASSMVSTDPQTALGWIGTMEDETARTRTLERVGREVVRQDPAEGPAMLEAAGLSADQVARLQRGRSGRGR